MDAEILREKAMMLPVEYKGSFQEAVDEVLHNYIKLLESYSASSNLIDDVEKFRHGLENLFREYYLGHQHKAYQAFDKARRDLLGSMPMVVSTFPRESLYRARTNEGNKAFGNNEMFHIKLDMRGKVATQRFSFPGLPCLYLGGSSYVCWLELNRPQIEKFQVALIRQSTEKEYKVIDLCIHPLTFFENLYKNTYRIGIEEYLRWWPMIAMCSFSVKNEEDPFKPEYIFPQFVLQYLLEGDADIDIIGIRYISTKAGKVSKKQYETDYRTYTNYVIPIKSEDKNANADGFCPLLSEMFRVVRNYDGKELQVLTDAIRQSGIKWQNMDEAEPKLLPLDQAKLYSTNDSEFPYKKTVFRRIEVILDNKDNSQFDDSGELVFSPISSEEIDAMFARIEETETD